MIKLLQCTIGVQWFSGRVLDLGSKGRLFETHLRHCIVSMSKTLDHLLCTGSTQEDRKTSIMTGKLLTEM